MNMFRHSTVQNIVYNSNSSTLEAATTPPLEPYREITVSIGGALV